MENDKLNELKVTPYCKMNGEQQQAVRWRKVGASRATCFPGCRGDTVHFFKRPQPLPSFLPSFLLCLSLSPDFLSQVNKIQHTILISTFKHLYLLLCRLCMQTY